ncbi:MAG: MFS transporter [Myxococcota bacterium]
MKRALVRLAWVGLLITGVNLFATPSTKGADENPVSGSTTLALVASTAQATEPAAEGLPAPASTEDGAAAPSEAPEAVPVPSKESEAQALVERFLLGLSEHVATTPEPADATVAEAVSALAFAGNGDDDKRNLRASFVDATSTGEYIHALRKRSFVPAASFHWLGYREATEGNDDVLLGVVTLRDGRSRALRASLDKGTKLITDLSRASLDELGGKQRLDQVFAQLKAGDADAVWQGASPKLRELRDAATFLSDVRSERLLDAESYTYADKTTGLEGGYRLDGTAKLPSGETIPFYAAFLDATDGVRLLDIQSTSGFTDRLLNGRGDGLDIGMAVLATALLLGFLYILFSYGKGLKGSPRELYLLFFTKVTEYSAYGAAQLAFMFYLREDMGLSEIEAGGYYSVWSTGVTLLTMMVGAVCDAIGVKKTLLVGSVALLLSRAAMPLTDNLVMATLFGFVPLAVGIAITGPVLSVGIKRYTTREGAALGFGLFYTLMNVGWAVGAWLFDKIRVGMGETGTLNFLGAELSTYQVIIGVGFFINVPDLLALVFMRDKVMMTENGIRFEKGDDAHQNETVLETTLRSIKTASRDTVKIFTQNFVQRAFWIFILLIGMTVFARLTFFHFHITWPSYGLRYFGEGSLVGNIFGVLNPVMIVFLVPVFAFITRKVTSYWMLLVGTLISVGSIFFVLLPPSTFAGLTDSWLGTIVFDRWLEVPVGFRDPYYLSMVLFVTVFTIGEAVWSPRLMQFTAEIAPPGREGSYVALSYLPYFGAKFIAGPMAGFLLTEYAPEFGVGGVYQNYPDHQLIWLWVGITAALTPVGLIVLRKMYRQAELAAADAAAAAAEAERAEG